MTHDFLIIFLGTALLAAGMSGLHPLNSYQTGWVKGLSLALALAGLGVIVAGALRTSPIVSVRFAIGSSYFAAATLLGGSAATLLINRLAGRVMIDLGTTLPKGFAWILVVTAPVGLFSVWKQFGGVHESSVFIPLVGQALYFLAFGIWGTIGLRTSWRFTERGIVGPWAFVPWKNCFSYLWKDAEQELQISVRRGVSRESTLKVNVPPERHQMADEILAAKVSKKY